MKSLNDFYSALGTPTITTTTMAASGPPNMGGGMNMGMPPNMGQMGGPIPSTMQPPPAMMQGPPPGMSGFGGPPPHFGGPPPFGMPPPGFPPTGFGGFPQGPWGMPPQGMAMQPPPQQQQQMSQQSMIPQPVAAVHNVTPMQIDDSTPQVSYDDLIEFV